MLAALLAEMKDMRGSGCFENCETEFRNSFFRQGGGSRVMGTRGQVCVVESTGDVKDHGGGDSLSEEHLMRSVYPEV